MAFLHYSNATSELQFDTLMRLSPHHNFRLDLLPNGQLVLNADASEISIEAALSERLRQAFERGPGHGLLLLGIDETGTMLPSVFSYWREFAARYVTTLCTQQEGDESLKKVRVTAPSSETLESIAHSVPPMSGAEYLNASVLMGLWNEIDTACDVELAESKHSIQEFLKFRNPAWNLIGRVHFNVAENRKHADTPFAFLATYTTKLSAQAKAQHLPLGQALREYSGAANKGRLLSLLIPVQRASTTCRWLKTMVDSGTLFHPLRWTPQEALELLRDVHNLETAGIVVRMPAQWRGNRPPRPKVIGTVGGKSPSGVGQNALIDFNMEVTLDGETLSAAEISDLLAQSDGLAMVRGRWIELDRKHLESMMKRFGEIERSANENGLSFGEAMRLVAGANVQAYDADLEKSADWAQVVAGPWLAEMLQGLRSPQGLAQVDPGDELTGTLRPYQQIGVRWLYLLSQLGLGACLADDMGLGKTMQVLSLLLIQKRQNMDKPQPSLLVAPASLLANWASEIERFAPSLKAMIAHQSAMPVAELKALTAERLLEFDLVITTYGSVLRLPWIVENQWRLAVLDEAQAIKNPDSKQTRAIKKLKATAKVALTGTPIENRLGDLWSIFDFVNPGLLGSAKEFTNFTKHLASQTSASYAPLRELVRPYILRRLKTDKTVIADLPDKTEIKAFCPLSRQQAALYQQAVEDLKFKLENSIGIERKGLVLSSLMRFKQICNHPSQWLGDGAWNEEASGKWLRLREIAEVIASKQEKMLVFTQFREVIGPLMQFLGSIFGRPGLELHGGTEVKKRKDLVRSFQENPSVGFFVLSLKAGGAGLNLTAASHVVHFDRWWNPAVENQATDRAFRIGQTKNVLVHKFVCRGTVEEKIDAMIESKRQISNELLEGDAGVVLTELTNDELLKLVTLDLNKALQET